MSKESRLELIRQIESERNSIVLTYLTSTRQNMEVSMALDTIRIFYEHLSKIPEKDKSLVSIDLFLVSNGGDGTVPWRLVTLIKEFCSKFCVLIPYRAFSAATLTALGADKIIMHPMGMLGPTDPTVANGFNPIDPQNGQKQGISVEDVTAYISLIKEDAGITHEDELVQSFNKLVDNVHPLALGNVKRSLAQSKMMAQKLLSLHMSRTKDAHQIDEIVDNLTSKLYYHGHPINRKEAIEQIGLKTVENASPKIEQLMWNLYCEYETELKNETPFILESEFLNRPDYDSLIVNTSISQTITSKLAYIESQFRTDYSFIENAIIGVKDQNNTPKILSNSILNRGWKTE